MTKVSNRDKKTAEQHGILPSTAANVKRMLSKARNELDDGLTKASEGSQSREKLLEKLHKFMFGTEESFPFTTSLEDLKMLKRWLEDVASQYFMLHAISLYEACYLAEFNHTNRVGVIKALNGYNTRFSVMLKVVNECILEKKSLRRFTADEQNAFLHS